MSISLVTGGSGFIGHHLVDELVAHGDSVRILDLEPPSRSRDGVVYIRGSVADAKLVQEAMEGVGRVYHVAALSDLWIPDPSMFHETNVVGTRVVMEAALRAEVERVVHTSSATVLIDDAIGPRPATLDEAYRSHECGLSGEYARSKWRAEQVAMGFADRLPIVIVLPTLPLGPGDRRPTPPGRMLLDLLRGRIGAYMDCILNVIDVRDVATGHRLASVRGRCGQRYILNAHSLPMADFLRALESVAGRPMPTRRIPGKLALLVSAAMDFWSSHVSGRAPIAPLAGTRTGLRPVIFDGRRAAAELSPPSTPLAETLSDAIAWFEHRGCAPRATRRGDFAISGD